MRGFTLIELLIVVIVIGLLAAVAVPRLLSARSKAVRSTLIFDLKNVAHAQELYWSDHAAYAGTISDLAVSTSEGVTVTIASADSNGWAALAVHSALPGSQCAIFTGSAAPVAPATSIGVPTCDF